MIDDRERLSHMLEAMERIERYTVRGREAFDSDELIQNWMIRHLEIVGEAARNVSPEFRDAHDELPWPEMIGMRHILVHEYFGIDLDIVWEVVNNRIPDLKEMVQAILTESGA